MKILVLFFLLVSSIASARTHVRGYTRRNGTHVSPHYRSDRNHSKRDNWSTKGNTNPVTGKRGTKSGD